MLVIRFNRSGRTNKAFFRIVATESSKPPKSGFIKVLGWYNPHTKDSSLNKEEILRYLDNGAKTSNSMAKFLQSQKVNHKNIKYIPDAPAKKKSKGQEEKPAAQPKTEDAKDTEATEPTNESIEEVASENVENVEAAAETTEDAAAETAE